MLPGTSTPSVVVVDAGTVVAGSAAVDGTSSVLGTAVAAVVPAELAAAVLAAGAFAAVPVEPPDELEHAARTPITPSTRRRRGADRRLIARHGRRSTPRPPSECAVSAWTADISQRAAHGSRERLANTLVSPRAAGRPSRRSCDQLPTQHRHHSLRFDATDQIHRRRQRSVRPAASHQVLDARRAFTTAASVRHRVGLGIRDRLADLRCDVRIGG